MMPLDRVALFETTDVQGNWHSKTFKGSYEEIRIQYYSLQHPEDWHLFDAYTITYSEDVEIYHNDEMDQLKKILIKEVA